MNELSRIDSSQQSQTQWQCQLLSYWSLLCVLFVLSVVVALVSFIAYQAAPALNPQLFVGDAPLIPALLGQVPIWDGIWPACVGTVSVMLGAVGLALIPGIATGVWLAKGDSCWHRVLQFAIDLLAGMPSILMGVFGFTLILCLRATFWPQANVSMLLAALCLALLITPYLTVTTKTALLALPPSRSLAAYALGMRPWQVLWYVELPQAKRGIIAGIMLSLGRAAEDTAVIMLTGAVANAGMPAGLLERFEALPFTIFYYSAQYQSQQELNMAFAAALVLLLMTASIFAVAGLFMGRDSRSVHM